MHTKDHSNYRKQVATVSLLAPYIEDRNGFPADKLPTLNIWPNTDYVVTNGFVMADESIRRGLQGKLVNMPLYTSSSLIAEGSLTPADNFSADETVTINGVTFTFKAVPSAAGEVDIGASTAVSIDNLVAAVNNSAGYAP